VKPSPQRSKFVSPKDVRSKRVYVSRWYRFLETPATHPDCAVASQNATKTLCSAPVRDESNVVSYSGVIGGALAVLAYILRMTSRLPRFGDSLGWDDAVITIAVLEVIPLLVLSVVCKFFAAN